MKKAARILLSSLLLVLMLFSFAYANSALPDPNVIEILLMEGRKAETVYVYASEDGEKFERAEENTGFQLKKTRSKKENMITFYNKDGKYRDFYLLIVTEDGERIETNVVAFEEWESYRCELETGELFPGEVDSYSKLHGYSYIFYPLFFLMAPLIVTLLVESGVARAFRLRPKKYVMIANCVTNPLLNIFIIPIYNAVYLPYWVILLVLETGALLLEFGFYVWRYDKTVYTKKRLFLYTLVANVLSWGIYYVYNLVFILPL